MSDHSQPSSTIRRTTMRGSISIWRQRIAGSLFCLGGLAAMVAFFLPWLSTDWPTDRHCPNCQPLADSPSRSLGVSLQMIGSHGISPSALLWVVLLALLMIALPLALTFLGLRLLAVSRAVQLRWRLLAVLASVIAFCWCYFLAVVIAFSYLDSTAARHIDLGESMALLAPCVTLLAAIVMPSRAATRSLASAPPRTTH